MIMTAPFIPFMEVTGVLIWLILNFTGFYMIMTMQVIVKYIPSGHDLKGNISNGIMTESLLFSSGTGPTVLITTLLPSIWAVVTHLPKSNRNLE